jgi:hypothetical protein
LKLKCGVLLSTSAFKIKLRLYIKSNHFCADDCNAAVQSALDTCVAWTNTLHVGDYAASTAAADACMTREQTAKGVCKAAAAAKCVEPIMRGFYAAGLKKNAVPRKAGGLLRVGA